MSTWYAVQPRKRLHNRGNNSKPILQYKQLLYNRENEFETIKLFVPTTHKNITELIPKTFGSEIPPPNLPNIIPKTIR